MIFTWSDKLVLCFLFCFCISLWNWSCFLPFFMQLPLIELLYAWHFIWQDCDVCCMVFFHQGRIPLCLFNQLEWLANSYWQFCCSWAALWFSRVILALILQIKIYQIFIWEHSSICLLTPKRCVCVCVCVCVLKGWWGGIQISPFNALAFHSFFNLNLKF